MTRKGSDHSAARRVNPLKVAVIDRFTSPVLPDLGCPLPFLCKTDSFSCLPVQRGSLVPCLLCLFFPKSVTGTPPFPVCLVYRGELKQVSVTSPTENDLHPTPIKQSQFICLFFPIQMPPCWSQITTCNSHTFIEASDQFMTWITCTMEKNIIKITEYQLFISQ